VANGPSTIVVMSTMRRPASSGYMWGGISGY
jgi:hypothetical protein